MLYEITINSNTHRLELNLADGQWSCLLDGREFEIDAVLVRPGVLSLRVDNQAYEIKSEHIANELYLSVNGTRFAAEVRDPRSLRTRSRAAEEHGPRKIVASMPGKIVRLLVRVGDAVEAGAAVVVVEAMKMQNEIRSPKKGVVGRILVSPGTAVNAGDVLAIID